MNSRDQIKNRKFFIQEQPSGAVYQEDGTFLDQNAFKNIDTPFIPHYFTHIDDACAKLLLLRLRDGPTNYTILEIIEDEWMPKRIKSPSKTRPKNYLRKVFTDLQKL